MIHVNIDRSEPIFWHDQVAAEIRRAIAEGEAGPGDRRPLVKDIAAVLGVNKNTVLRAMHILLEVPTAWAMTFPSIGIAGPCSTDCSMTRSFLEEMSLSPLTRS
jgi:hypothetical protein